MFLFCYEDNALNVQRCLHSIRVIEWKKLPNDSKVRRKILSPKVQSLGKALNENRLRWMRHVLCMPTEQLSRWALISNRWKMSPLPGLDNVKRSLQIQAVGDWFK